jgi:hypothetical protein
MRAHTLAVGVLLPLVLISNRLLAQGTGPAVAGTVTNARQAATNSAGISSVRNLRAAEDEVFFTADGTLVNTPRTSLGSSETVNLIIGTPPQAAGAGQEPRRNPPNAASKPQTGPSVEDLGFPAAETKGSAEEQARLDKRTHMLKIHQQLGLITTAPLLATVISGGFAGGRSTGSTARDLHAALGAATAGLYFTAASYAIFAPRIAGTPTRGPIRLHKTLAWIHGPGMVLTPILGVMAYRQKSNGERIQGIATAHTPLAIVTAGAYGAALLSVSLKF